MDKKEINRIRALCDATTSEKWMYWHKDMKFVNGDISFGAYDSIVHDQNQRNICPVFNRFNAAFIAEARIIIPVLLDEIERLQSL